MNKETNIPQENLEIKVERLKDLVLKKGKVVDAVFTNDSGRLISRDDFSLSLKFKSEEELRTKEYYVNLIERNIIKEDEVKGPEQFLEIIFVENKEANEFLRFAYNLKTGEIINEEINEFKVDKYGNIRETTILGGKIKANKNDIFQKTTDKLLTL